MGWDEVLGVRVSMEADWRVRTDEAYGCLIDAYDAMSDVLKWSQGVLEYSPWPPPADSVFAQMQDYVDAAEQCMLVLGNRINTWNGGDFDE